MSTALHPAMAEALKQAQIAVSKGEIPVGAAITDANGVLLAATHNLVETTANPLAHAELLALQQSITAQGTTRSATGKAGKYLEGCTLAVTLEPCAMCAQALAHARIGTVLFGAYDPKSGGTTNGARVFSHSHHKPQVLGGIEEEACRTMLQQFFAKLRA